MVTFIALMRSKARIHAADDPRVLALQEAIQLGGGLARLAHGLGIKSQSIYNWELCPAARCKAIARLTGVSESRLRPDVFGEEARCS